MRGLLLKRTRRRRGSDFLITFCTIFLVVFGLIMLASASSNLGKIRFGDTYYFLKHQLLYGLSLGIVGFLFGSLFYYRHYEKLAIILLIISIGLLLLIQTPLGIKAGGAERWLQIGPVTFQPSEILKVSLIIYLAAWLSKRRERANSFTKGFLPFAVVVGLITFLLIRQPSTTSAAILLAISFIVYFASGARPTYLIGLILIGVLALGSLIYFTPYRWDRIKAYLNPEINLQSSGYHINQALISIGSGGFWGVGYGQSTTKIRHLPEPIGDSIFAVIAEELGFVGAVALIGVILLFVIRTFYIAIKARDKFGQLLLIGFASLVAIQSFINIGAISGVLPLTGAPLPFISYGGTALAIFMMMAGIINNVAKHS